MHVESEKVEPPGSNVVARLVSMTKPGEQYDILEDTKELIIGRRALGCHIVVDDKRCSGKHLRIYRDPVTSVFFVEQLGMNTSYVNDNTMEQGDTRTLTHGDAVSVLFHPHAKYADDDEETKPFAAFVFRQIQTKDRVAEETADGGLTRPSSSAADEVSTAVQEAQSLDLESQRLRTEEQVKELWDVRVVLGKGNFSEVRMGVNVRDGAKRAMKIVDRKKFVQFQSARESRLSLADEANLAASLDHPGIVKCFEWFQTEAHLYLVMELVEGGDLLQDILEKGAFEEHPARELFRQVCEAVAYLHDRSVVHRDLKPDNILLTSRDRNLAKPKLADLGLARKNMKSRDCRTFCGTPHYFAPEVINTFQKRAPDDSSALGYGQKVDMWSLGVVLYILLSGMPPFEDEGLYEQILHGRYEFEAEEWVQISIGAKDLVQLLMTVDPDKRPKVQTALSHRWFQGMTTTCLDGKLCEGSPVKRARCKAGAILAEDEAVGCMSVV